MKLQILTVLTLSLVTFNACCEGRTDMSPNIEEVKTEHVDRLLALPGVVSVGIGSDSDGNPAIVIGLDGPRPDTEAQIPSSLEDYPVVVQVIGPIRAQ